MYFFLRPIVYFLIDPVVFTALLAAVTWFLNKKGKKKASLFLAIVFVVWFFTVVFSPLAIVLTRNTERTFPEFSDFDYYSEPDQVPHIIVLGAGYTPDPELNPTNQIGATVALRLQEGIRIYRRLPRAKFITSGVYSKSDTLSQGLGVSRAAVILGVSPADTAFLPETENTEQEARDFVRRFGKKEVIVVSHALHMPRAVKWFKHFGAKPIPAPMGHKIKNDPFEPDSGWGFSLSKFKLLKKWIKEKTGSLYADLKM